MKELIKRNKLEIIVVLVFMFFAFGFNIYRVQGDGLSYYAFLEKTLNISNPESSSVWLGKSFYFFQRGCCFFNMPFYLSAYLIEKLFNLSYLNFNGITLRQISINLASNFYMVLSLILLIKILKNLKLNHIIFPVISILFSTSAFTVAVIMPSWPHAVDIFIMTLFIYCIMRYQKYPPVKTLWIGIVIVVATLIRYFNFILMVPLLIYYIYLKDYKRIKFLLLGFVGAMWLIPLVLYIYNGSFSPFYNSGMTISTTITEVRTSPIPPWPKYMLKLLIHPLHGLFVWAPITIFSAIGLIFAPKEKKENGYLLTGIWFSFLFLYGFFHLWNSGWCFTNRYLVNLFPIYVIGLSMYLDKYGKKIYWFLIPLTFYSIILFLNWYLCIMNGEFGTPGNMVQAWVKGESATFVCKTVNIKIFLSRLWEMCRYKYIFRIF